MCYSSSSSFSREGHCFRIFLPCESLSWFGLRLASLPKYGSKVAVAHVPIHWRPFHSLSLSLLYTQTFLPIAVLTVHFLMTPSFPFFLCFIITASSHSRRPCQTGGEKEEVTVAYSSAEDGILQSTFQTNHSCNEHQPARTALERPEDCLAGCAVLCPRTALRFPR